MNAPHNNSEALDYLRTIDETLKASPAQPVPSAAAHWFDAAPSEFTAAQRAHTTILHAGLTMAHDLFIQSAFRGLGYKVQAMEVPDNDALQLGREFGNRGQCNPTYFTVGNLVKQLKAMEAAGIAKQDIIKNYIFATAGSCGPCRFGTYVTEYRKALRDAGFEGFRVILFQQAGGIKQATGQNMGLKIDAQFFLTMTKAIILGDVLNALMYRIRPYETEPGRTDEVIQAAKNRIAQAFESRRGLLKALWQTRKALAAIPVDYTQIKPKVAIIGEFWAMTTEGDGNYKMHRFLEREGAEVDIQLVVNWGLYLLWGAEFDTRQRMYLKGVDKSGPEGSKFALERVNVAKKLASLKAAQYFVRGLFSVYAKLLGLKDYHLPDMNFIAKISHAFYDNNLRGGEGHMEVGKLIHNVVDQKVNMTLSIKPFGCMPSSSVSDGVQSLITEMYPAALFLPIETNGDGAVNVYSRVQMQLFKAKQVAQREWQDTLDSLGWSQEDLLRHAKKLPQLWRASHRSPHYGANTAVDTCLYVAAQAQPFWQRWRAALLRVRQSTAVTQALSLARVERAATAFKARKNQAVSAVKIVEVA
jgi:predicted nucleotide-binding protein (sugar kinase/HSP70/actin superfamily)